MVRLNDEHDRNRRAQLVAYLLSQGVAQKDVSALLKPIYGEGPVQSTIAKAKEDAETNRWLRLNFVSSNIARDDLEWVLALGRDYNSLSERLTKESKDEVFKRLCVCYSGEAPAQQTPEYWTAAIARFSQSASLFLERELAKSKGVIGVSWGRTVAEVVRAMAVWQETEARSHWIVMPTSGDPVGENIAGCSSTDIAEATSKRLHCKSLSLRGLFATIPDELETSRDALFEFFSRIADYEMTLGPSGLYCRLDTFITSVGNFDQQSKIYTQDLMKAGGRTRDELKSLAYGDVGGPLIPIDKENPAYKRLSHSWTGIGLTSVARVASEAKISGAPGVVVVALGSNKADVLLEAIRRGLVTSAICDHHLALAVAARLGLSVGVKGPSAK